MSSLPKKCLVDTNVPKTANLALDPATIPQELTGCVLACVEAVEHVVKMSCLVMDAGDEIFDEYRKQLSMKGQPGVGDRFMKTYLHLPCAGQWKKLPEWLKPRTDTFFEQLTDRYILFGEWCYAQHSVIYDRLPDWFLGFDVFDKSTAKFFSCSRRDEAFQALGISKVPVIKRGRFSLLELKSLLSQSKLSDQPAEGLYLRLDQGDWLEQRAKLVRPAFIQSVEQHWSRSSIRANQLRLGIGNRPYPGREGRCGLHTATRRG